MTTPLLALFCGLLLAVIVVEVIHRPGAEDHLGQGPGTARRLVPQATKAATQAEGSTNPWMTAALARPLFAPDRKPVADIMATKGPMPRLTGIFASSDAAVAIFQPEGDAKAMVARRGESVGGWEVTAITADAVDLRKENQAIVLSPRFAEHDGAAAKEMPTSRSRRGSPPRPR
jgi:hypothetical protein